MQSQKFFTATNRFGLGYLPDPAGWVVWAPQGWLTYQLLTAPRSTPKPLASYPSTKKILGDIYAVDGNGAAKNRVLTQYRKIYQAELIDRAEWHITTDRPYLERLVMFWGNHFSVSNKGITYSSLPAYEREAIRPHVLSSFDDMLIAAVQHPAMLIYLDNVKSIGPNSKKRGRINENLAREVLELHTLGVNGGYTQKDIIEFAKALTGWTFSPTSPGSDPTTGFYFDASAHEPGPKTVLGKTYKENGVNEGIAILRDLARHPSTARHIGMKLARHFVSDTPPNSSVNRLTHVFRWADANLIALAWTLVDLRDAWSQPLTKAKTPYELFIAFMRATGQTEVKPMVMFKPMEELNHMPFSAPSPAGWPDSASFWIAPEAVMRRAEWVYSNCIHIADKYEPMDILDRTIGGVASKQTREEVKEAPTRTDALALVLASAEFQRR